ncbi:MAG: EpsG family protein [Pseudobutyrivibrio sp.]|nr:EpsG family protein [Pseudobutyrivibrio sp.]
MSKKKHEKPFIIMWIILTLMLIFRYGQGTDYYAYFLQYEYIDSAGSFWINALGHGEIGWYILLLTANKLGLSFFVFLGIISFVMMISIYRVISKYSPYKILSLLLLFPTFYLTYCYSAIRQGLVLCLFLGFGFELLLNKKYLKYYLLTFVLVLFHTSAVILLLLPALLNWKNNKILIALGLSIVGGFVIYYGQGILMAASESYRKVEFSILAIVVRLIVFYVVRKLYKSAHISEVNTNDKVISVAYSIYEVGILLFMALCWTSTLSQRLTMPLKAVEIFLIPMLMYRNSFKLDKILNSSKYQSVVISLLLIVAITNVEFVKNIYSYINQGNYRSFVTPLNYPYVSVFNQQEIYTYITNFDEEL